MNKLSFPKAVNPPKVLKPYAPLLGWIAAGLSTVFAVVHLFRIDTFLPILHDMLTGTQGWAIFVGLLVIFMEIFGIPFALRMKLSPLAHLVSGFCLAMAPLIWLLISVWAFGVPASTSQLGEFITVLSTPLVLLLNVLWLGFTLFTLRVLGYNTLKLADVSKSLSK